MRCGVAPMICAVFYGASGRCASALYKPGPIVIGCWAEGCGGSQMARGRSGLVWLYRLFKSITSVFRGCAGIDFVTFLSTWIALPGSTFLKNGVVKIFTIQVSSLSLKLLWTSSRFKNVVVQTFSGRISVCVIHRSPAQITRTDMRWSIRSRANIVDLWQHPGLWNYSVGLVLFESVS